MCVRVRVGVYARASVCEHVKMMQVYVYRL